MTALIRKAAVADVSRLRNGPGLGYDARPAFARNGHDPDYWLRVRTRVGFLFTRIDL